MNTLSLTILGASAATQNPGGACSSYLVRGAETALALDMGSGAFARLQGHVAPAAVDALVISHMHADHTLDLIPYRYYLAFSSGVADSSGAPDRSGRPRLLLPPGGHDTLLALSRLQDPSPAFYTDVFDVAEYDPERPLRVGALTLSFYPMRHITHTYGMRVSAASGASAGVLAYSADSGPCQGLLDVARDADLFLCENANSEDSAYPLHLTPRQAAAHARDAGARRLLLTHRWHVYGLDEAARAAADIFDGPVSVAREGETYAVRP